MKDNVTPPTTDIAIPTMEAVQQATRPEVVKEIVEKRVSKAVEDAIDNAMRSYSPFGKDLEKKIQEALSIQNLNLPQYNSMIGSMIEKLVTGHVSELIEGRLKKDLAELLKLAPKTIKLSEIVDEMRRGHEGDGGYGEVVTCHIERDDERSEVFGPYWIVYLDETEHLDWSSRKRAQYAIHLTHGLKGDKNQPNEDIQTGHIYHITQGSHTLTGQGRFPAGKPHGLGERLMALYAAESIIGINEDDVDVTVGDY